jgi:hypothetical protein
MMSTITRRVSKGIHRHIIPRLRCGLGFRGLPNQGYLQVMTLVSVPFVKIGADTFLENAKMLLWELTSNARQRLRMFVCCDYAVE